MNARERFLRTAKGQSVDRILNEELGYWQETIKRWQQQGLPEYVCKGHMEYAPNELLRDYFGLDLHVHGYMINKMHGNSGVNVNFPIPPFEEKIIEQTENYVIKINSSGITIKESVNKTTLPSYIKNPVSNKKDFQQLKYRFDPTSSERFPHDWDEVLKKHKRRTYPLGIHIHGFFGQAREWMGLENLMITYYDCPALIEEMAEFWGEYLIVFLGKLLNYIKLDFVQFWEDMAYKNGAMVSPSLFKKYCGRSYKKTTDFLKSRGVDIILVDCDGDVHELVPVLIELGVTGVFPLEQAAGTNVALLQKEYGNEGFLLIGGVDKRSLISKEGIDREIKKIAPLIKRGRFIPTVDHLIPPNVPFEMYRYYLKRKASVL